MDEVQLQCALPTGPLLGIDYGSVRVGLAICDRDQKIAVPLAIYQRQNRQQDASYFLDLVRRERIAGFVIGLPVHMSGSESGKSREVRRYGDWLSQLTGLPVAYSDERYTSTFAWDELKAGGLKAAQRRKQLDKVAAQIILQAFLDKPRNSSPDSGGESLLQPKHLDGDNP